MVLQGMDCTLSTPGRTLVPAGPNSAAGPAEGAVFGVTTEDLKIRFGVLALKVVELGLGTPPIAMNALLISARRPDVSVC